MRPRKVAGIALAVLLPATVVAAPSIITGFANFVNGSSPMGASNGSEVVPVIQNGATSRLPLTALLAAPTTVVLSGAATIPSGSHLVNAAPGSTLTLPSGAAVGTTEYVSDYQGGATAAPVTVAASADAPIVGSTGSYALTVSGQATGFARTGAGTWQPY